MMTPRELRSVTLQKYENRVLQRQYLDEYEQWGIGDDQDPTFYEIFIPTIRGEDPADTTKRMLDALTDAMAVRRATPSDFDGPGGGVP